MCEIFVPIGIHSYLNFGTKRTTYKENRKRKKEKEKKRRKHCNQEQIDKEEVCRYLCTNLELITEVKEFSVCAI